MGSPLGIGGYGFDWIGSGVETGAGSAAEGKGVVCPIGGIVGWEEGGQPGIEEGAAVGNVGSG